MTYLEYKVKSCLIRLLSIPERSNSSKTGESLPTSECVFFPPGTNYFLFFPHLNYQFSIRICFFFLSIQEDQMTTTTSKSRHIARFHHPIK